MRYVAVTPEQAARINAAVAPNFDAGPPARPFLLRLQAEQAERALTCLTQAVYYEAAVEPVDGQRAVAQVVINRVRSPAFPASVCGVVFQGAERRTGCQFTFTCDGSLNREPSRNAWALARAVAAQALKGAVFAPVGNATHYHADWVLPYWAPSLTPAARVGAHLFYRWRGYWGLPASFRQRHAGFEPEVAAFLQHGLKAASPAAAEVGGDTAFDPSSASKLTAALATSSSSDALSAGSGELRPELQRELRVPAVRATPELKADREAGTLRTGNFAALPARVR